MKTDIKFIAKKAGVSIATVSRVLNNSKTVSDELKQRVMTEVERYDYRPNTLARSLILNKTNLIGVVAPNVSNLYHAEMLGSIEKKAEDFGYGVLVSNVYSDFEKEKKSFQIFHERCVDGIILLHENTPKELHELSKFVSVPIVLASVNVEETDFPTVGIDEEKAAYEAVSYLIRLGHKKIAAVISSSYSLGTLRRRGYEKALADAGINFNDEYVVFADCTIEDGERATERILDCADVPTAVFCVSDEIAIGVMNYLYCHGYNVPDDFSVMGFDNINLAKIIRPHLTTVNQPVNEIGQQATDLLIRIINERTYSSRKITLQHSIVLRDSCKRLI